MLDYSGETTQKLDWDRGRGGGSGGQKGRGLMVSKR